MPFTASVRFKAVNAGFKQSIVQMQTSVSKFSGQMTADMARAGNQLGKVKGMIGSYLPLLGAAGAISLGSKSIELWGVQEAAISNVNAGLEATNNLLGISSENLQKMASTWQGKSIFGDEAILQNVTAQLLTFSGIGAKNFDSVQKAALDIASKLKGVNATGEDLRGTSIMLGKALNDPARGMAALRRIGISFSETTTKRVKQLVEQGKLEKGQALMLKEIEKQYGGTAQALLKTSKGMEIFKKNAIGDQMEEIGKPLVSIKEALLNLSSVAIKFVNFVINNPIGNVILTAVAAWKAYELVMIAVVGIKKIYLAVQSSTMSRMQLMFTIIAMLVVGIIWLINNWKGLSNTTKIVIGVVGGVIGIIGAVIGIMKVWTSITKIAGITQLIFNAILTANPIGIIVVAIGLLIAGIALLIIYWDKVKVAVDNFSNTTIGALLGIIFPFTRILELISFVQDRWQGLKKAFEGGFGNGLMAVGKMLLNFVLKPIETILAVIAKATGADWAKDALGTISEFRKGLDNGLIDESKVVNKDATLTEKQYSEKKTTQNVQIEIKDPLGRTNVTGGLEPIPIMVNSTRQF